MTRPIFIRVIIISTVPCSKKQTKEATPKLLTVEDFNELEKEMFTGDEKEFDEIWGDLRSRLYSTIQLNGIEFYSLLDRYEMSKSLLFHVGLNSDYVTSMHGTAIQGVVSLLQWGSMEFDIFDLRENKKTLNLDI